MDNQHRQIKGYRELSQAEIDLMNEIKAMGPQLESLCEKVAEHIRGQHEKADDAEMERLKRADPHHWLNWAKSGFQAELMYLTRAVAQPTFF